MKKTGFLALIAVMIFLIQSCMDSQPGQGMLPNVSGSSGEVVVVIDKGRWDGVLGEKIREAFASPIDGLPQSEANFDLVNINADGFGKFLMTHRNVIIIETGAGKESKATFQTSTYSYSQLMISLQGEDDESIIELIEKEKEKIIDKINIAERDRWISVYKKSLNSVNFTKLRENHKLVLHIPSNYAMAVEEKGFVWMTYETPTVTQSVLLHYFDYNGENYFNKDSIKSIRNNMTRMKIEGPVDNTWMIIEDRFPVNYRTFKFRDRNYIEMRGLWTLENGFMGGPFVTLVTKDEVNNRFVMLDGFVYAPSEEKRELLRQLEAIIYTVSFPDESEIIIKADKPKSKKD